MRFLIFVPFLLFSNLQALAQEGREEPIPLAEFYIDLNSWVERVSFSADGSRFALAHIGDEGLSIGVYDVATVEQIATFRLPEVDEISSLSLGPYGEGLAAAFGQSRGQIWHVDTETILPQFEQRSLAGAKEVIWSPDGEQIAWRFEEGLSLMDVRTATILKNYRTTEDAFVDWHGDHLRILNVWSNRDKLRVSYNSSNGEEAEWELEYSVGSPTVTWRADGRAFFLIDKYGDHLFLFDLDSQGVLHNQDGSQDDLPDTFRVRYDLQDLAFSPADDLYALSSEGVSPFVIDAKTHEIVSTCQNNGPDSLFWSPDASMIALEVKYGPTFFCNVVSGQLLGLNVSLHTLHSEFLAWAPSGDRFFMMDRSLGRVSIWPTPQR